MSRLTYSLGVLLMAVIAVVGIRVSSAEFTDGSVTRTEIGAARDWTPPVVSVNNPGNSGNVVNGTVTVTANASDADTAVASVLIEVAGVGSSAWTTLCTDSANPWSCTWDSTTVADGDYKLRATATDLDGNTATSAEVTTEVINTMRVHLEQIASPTHGAITFTGRFYNSGGWTVSMRIQAYVPGSGWQDIPGCGPANGTVRTCTYDTTGAASGTYDIRAVGTVFWWTYTDTQTGVVIDNTAPWVSQSLSGSTYLSGAISWTANATDDHSGVASVAFEYRLAAGAWQTCGVDASAPYACNFSPATFADGSYDFRTTVTDQAGNTVSSSSITRIVDNEGPVVALSVPAGPISGPVAMTATATDAGAGMAGGPGVQFQYRLEGVTGWSGCGNDSSSPYACTTGTLPNGTYEFRAIATNANNRATTSAVETRVVDTVIASVSVTAPTGGSTIWGSTTVTAAASSNQGVNSVTLQYKTGTGSWTNVCPADTVSPYSCTWNPATLPYGSYQLQAVMSHGSGLSLTSSAVSVVVPQPGGYDVQGAGSPNSTPSSGDTIVLTYNDTMDLSTIDSGLTTTTSTSATAILTGNSNGTTTATFSGANLGTVVYDQLYVDAGRTVNYAVTVAASTTTAHGISVTRITLTLGNRTGGMSWYVNTDSSTGAMSWAPSASAQDTNDNAASTTTTTELGGGDRDM